MGFIFLKLRNHSRALGTICIDGFWDEWSRWEIEEMEILVNKLGELIKLKREEQRELKQQTFKKRSLGNRNGKKEHVNKCRGKVDSSLLLPM